MSDTPETDHLESNLGNAAHPALSSFCRKLERERDEARAQRDAVTLRLGETQERMIDAQKQRDRLAEAMRSIKNELGVPQPEYPAPVANAVNIADEALQSLTPNEL